MKSPTAPPPSPLVFLLLAALQSVVTVASIECDPTTPSLASLVSFTDDLRGAAAAYASSSADGTIACPADPNNVFGRSHQRVLLLGIDGLRADAAAMLPLPNLHRLSTMGTSTVSTCTCNTYKSNHNMSMSWVMGHSLATRVYRAVANNTMMLSNLLGCLLALHLYSFALSAVLGLCPNYRDRGEVSYS